MSKRRNRKSVGGACRWGGLVGAVAAASGTPSWGAAPATINTVRVGSGFSNPMFITSPPNDPRLFVAERGGTIRILDNLGVNGAPSATATLNITSLVDVDGEHGLLGLAFDPNFSANRRFYVNYIEEVSLDTVVASYELPVGSNVADTAKRIEVLRIDQPNGRTNHKAGWIGFRPGEAGANLYIAVGDGGSGNDPDNNGQTLTTNLGKMLRIDVSNPTVADPYNIPAGNPFPGASDGNDEIWAYGLRNPFRNSFDRGDSAGNHRGDFYIADVGQNEREEVNFEAGPGVAGRNYGWRAREGKFDNPNVSDTLPAGSYTDPFHDYDSNGSAVIGGYVYRGSAYPELQGTYFFADEVDQLQWTLKFDGTTITEFTDRTAQMSPGGVLGATSSFGEDAAGEMYLANLFGGEIYRIITPGRFNWNLNNAGTWSATANWIEGVANGAGAVVTFGNKITAARTVTLDSARTVGTLNFDNANSYTIAGSANLTLNTTAAAAEVNVLSGNHTISAPLLPNLHTTFNVAAGSTLTVTNLIGSSDITAKTMTKTGAGTWAVNRVRSLGLNVQAGKVEFIANGTDTGTSYVDALTIAGTTDNWTAKLDLKNNDLVIRTNAGTRVGKVAEIMNQLKQGSNFESNVPAQFWTGNGIVTSLGGNGTSTFTAIGVIYNDFVSVGQTAAPIYTLFSGQTVDANNVLVKYTYFGDADLDGNVTTNDYFQIDNGFLGGKTSWINGDFDYDGAVTTNDYFLIDNAFLGQTGAIVPAGAGSVALTAVPEPAAILSVVGFAASRMLPRRRRLSQR